jgi:hypothetical protein
MSFRFPMDANEMELHAATLPLANFVTIFIMYRFSIVSLMRLLLDNNGRSFARAAGNVLDGRMLEVRRQIQRLDGR